MRNDTELELIRKAMGDEDWDTALRLAGRFRRLGEHAAAIKRAAEALTNPSFYKELGFDLDKIRAEGIEALKERFSKSWEEVRARRSK